MKFKKMCKDLSFFTRGTITQYNISIEYYNEIIRCDEIERSILEPLVYMVYICSDTNLFTVEYIRKHIYELIGEFTMIR